MIYALWSLKGGVGTTVATSALALHWSPHQDILLVDLCGDLPYALGIPEPDKPGISDWLAAGDDLDSDVLSRLEVGVATGLSLLGRGRRSYPDPHSPDFHNSEPHSPDSIGSSSNGTNSNGSSSSNSPLAPETTAAKFQVLCEHLESEDRTVLVDCGNIWGHQMNWNRRKGHSCKASGTYPSKFLIEAADHSLLVTNSCFLALRRISRAPHEPTGLVLMYEEGRALTAPDISDLASCPVMIQIPHDVRIGRALDAGLLIDKLPDQLSKPLQNLKQPENLKLPEPALV